MNPVVPENDSVPKASTGLFPAKETCTYTKCYCEENVWKLCEFIQTTYPTQLDKCYSVFISNPKQAVPIWHQGASASPEYPVVWDYHVIFLFKDENESLVYDLDTRLEFPEAFDVYMAHSIRLDEAIKSDYHRYFRVVPAALYLQTFSCDRSHMRKADQTWMAPPPDYPCIQVEGVLTNLSEFMSMDNHAGHGKVMNVSELVKTFGDLNIYRELALQHYQE